MRDRVIVALDADERAASEIAARLRGHAKTVKVGLTLFFSAGPAVVTRLRGDGYDVFLDLKLHDIPHQVAGAARAVGGLGARMLSVHAVGGAEMIRAALDGAQEGAEGAGLTRPAILAVTILTSMNPATMAETGMGSDPDEQVLRLAQLARDAGADGVVCSPQEAGEVRRVLGPAFLVVTPGVRPPGADRGDQSRVATPASAFAAGASHIIVGRPVTQAADPAAAFEKIVREVSP